MLERFYKEHYRTVYAYLLSLCKNPSLAEDLTSETFLKALQKLDSYDPKYHPTTWLCTIGKNLFYNHCKKKKLFPLPEEFPIAVPSPEALYIQKEQLQQFYESAQLLPELQRQVLSMRLEGLSFRQIGAALDRTENWARVTFYRAKSSIILRMEESL